MCRYYCIWGLIPLHLLLCCCAIPSPFSFENIVVFKEPGTERSAVPGPITHQHGPASSGGVPPTLAALWDGEVPTPPAAPPEPQTAFVFDWKIIWYLGIIVMACVLLRQTLMVRRWLAASELVANEAAMQLFLECRQKMNVKTWLVLAESPKVDAPFLVGIIRPTLLLPKDFCTENDPQKIRTVFLHELAHLKRWDTWTCWGTSLLLAVFWFNPLLWLAVRRMNDDKEEACDVLALEALQPQERPQYGRMLLTIVKISLPPRRAPGLVGISENGQSLIRRLDMLNQLGTWKLRYKILATILVLPLFLAASTVAQDRTAKEIKAEIKRLKVELKNAKDAEKQASTGLLGTIYKRGDDDKLPSDFLLLQFLGTYEGAEGKNKIEFSLCTNVIRQDDPEYGQLDGPSFEVFTSGRESHNRYKISRNLQVTIQRKMQGRYDEMFFGILKYISENEMELKVVYQINNGRGDKVSDALEKLPVKVIRDGEEITLEIPKNKVWDEIRVKRVVTIIPCHQTPFVMEELKNADDISSDKRTLTQTALEEAKKAVVAIKGDQSNRMGSGVLIDPRGYIVTCLHVIDGLSNINVTTSDNKEYKGILIARDPDTDIAIIKINGNKPFATIKTGRSEDVVWGEKVYVIGNPFGYLFSVADGMVSGLQRDIVVNEKLTYTKAIQISVPISSGYSGAPLLNVNGEMIGMVTAIHDKAQLIAFAIPVDQVVEVASRLIQSESEKK